MFDLADELMKLLDDYQYWVIGLEFKRFNPDGSKRYVPRSGYSLDECLKRLAEMPPSGSLEELKTAIEKAKHASSKERR